MRRIRTLLLGSAAVLVVLVVEASPASADRLVASSPAQGAAVEKAPTAVVLTFDVAISSATVVCTDTFGRRVPVGRPKVAGRSVTTSWPAGQKPGLFRFGWTVRSTTGRTTTGVLTFSYSNAPKPPPTPTSSPTHSGSSPPAATPAPPTPSPSAGLPDTPAPGGAPALPAAAWGAAGIVVATLITGLIELLGRLRRRRTTASGSGRRGRR